MSGELAYGYPWNLIIRLMLHNPPFDPSLMSFKKNNIHWGTSYSNRFTYTVVDPIPTYMHAIHD